MSHRFLAGWNALPLTYVEFLEAHPGWEGFLADNDEYVALWDKDRIQESYKLYELEEFLDPRWFPIGSNGGDEMLCVDLESKDHAVYWLPFIGMSDEEPMLKYRSLRDLVDAINSTF